VELEAYYHGMFLWWAEDKWNSACKKASVDVHWTVATDYLTGRRVTAANTAKCEAVLPFFHAVLRASLHDRRAEATAREERLFKVIHPEEILGNSNRRPSLEEVEGYNTADSHRRRCPRITGRLTGS
jgi:hypothetical protein